MSDQTSSSSTVLIVESHNPKRPILGWQRSKVFYGEYPLSSESELYTAIRTSVDMRLENVSYRIVRRTTTTTTTTVQTTTDTIQLLIRPGQE